MVPAAPHEKEVRRQEKYARVGDGLVSQQGGCWCTAYQRVMPYRIRLLRVVGRHQSACLDRRRAPYVS